jgi:RHS repeat-associated protein
MSGRDSILLATRETEYDLACLSHTGNAVKNANSVSVSNWHYIHGGSSSYPQIGRFLSADTMIPDPFDSQSFNRYSYVLNNPLKYVDPTGHENQPPDGAGGSYIPDTVKYQYYPSGPSDPSYVEPPIVYVPAPYIPDPVVVDGSLNYQQSVPAEDYGNNVVDISDYPGFIVNDFYAQAKKNY